MISTPTLILAMQHSQNHKETSEILSELQKRNDVFNHEPIVSLIIDISQPSEVRRAATECAATLRPENTIEWLRGHAQNRFLAPNLRKLAIQGLCWCKSPGQTLPVLETLAADDHAQEIRVAAIQKIGVFKNMRCIDLLMRLCRDRDVAVADTAQLVLDTLIQAKGGLGAVIDHLKERADHLSKQGQPKAALEALSIATQIAPTDGSVRSRIARLRSAA